MSDLRLLEKLTVKQRQTFSVLVLAALHNPKLLDVSANHRPDSVARVLRQTFDILKQQS
jgi:hypothetical protein